MRTSLVLVALSLALSLQANAQTSAKTTATGSRLIAETDLYSDGIAYIPEDSITYNYSGTRGGDLTHTMQFDNGIDFYYNNSTATYINAGNTVQTFDANNNLLTSVIQDITTVGGGIINNRKYAYTYDGSNNQLTSLYQTWDTIAGAWVNEYQITNTYDAANNLATSISQDWVSGTWVNGDKGIYTYDGEHNMLSSLNLWWNTTTSTWYNYSNFIITYTTTNKQATTLLQAWNDSVWVNISKAAFTYDASDNKLSGLYQFIDSATSTWVNGSQEILTYDAANDQLTDLFQQWVAGAWQNNILITNTGFVDKQPLVFVVQGWSTATASYINEQRDSMTYNTFGQETNNYTTNWDDTSGTWAVLYGDGVSHFYYETYTTSVSNITNSNCTASVYPVPAKDMLHVSITWNEPQAFSIEIMDMSGRAVNTRQIPECKTYDGNISINNLPAGNYIMKMTGTDAQSMQQIVVAK